MQTLAKRSWVPTHSENYIQSLAEQYAALNADALEAELDRLITENRDIHEQRCINLNPATNVMNPKAEAVLGRGLGSRPSLGYPGDKYEMGLEAIEKIEVIATELACEVFNARFAEIRVASGAMANLYAFMATCQAGSKIIAQSPDIGGHITHHQPGAAGLFGLEIHTAPVDIPSYTIDVEALRQQAHQIKPQLITVGGSLNLCPHPIRQIRQIADEVGAYVLFDAAHLSGMIAGRAWQQPLEEGAHLMTMSTYKSLGGPPSGLLVTNEPELAQRLDQIAYPGLTANFDAAKSASLAITLLDWKVYGQAYAAQMAETAIALAQELAIAQIPVFKTKDGYTHSHQFAIIAEVFGGGQQAAKLLRRANLLTSGIGLPIEPIEGDLNGLRIGTPEIVRWGMTTADMGELATLISRVLIDKEPPETVALDVLKFRQRFQTLHFMR
ncbi:MULTISPECIES: aminotransferase class I/II-fold pyridoxal phosphate-dependent enzyme [unclassified Leptolyngbya]|uniref:serine hydroxymethyltransferase n=1 Tax=unclassified Leptolyngbya TaxID=2650499 RepID=UPI0016844811|nr:MULTISPECIES: aminotransferase class I/II-fold pyridoxal phosphate-dependent enzyme [unclassified Leptolyngbya]MBD1912308.1 aminotransferase class I/II-fold pyridoxal phosphate-dependent enzyme [Leptolyngbya sp. FACHB-8]MBD2158056.1 aminotransferase class I/II-fold pyridoxal phosphate-dependent enzyme [Leptolyngbya sp. FACHB-16]